MARSCSARWCLGHRDVLALPSRQLTMIPTSKNMRWFYSILKHHFPLNPWNPPCKSQWPPCHPLPLQVLRVPRPWQNSEHEANETIVLWSSYTMLYLLLVAWSHVYLDHLWTGQRIRNHQPDTLNLTCSWPPNQVVPLSNSTDGFETPLPVTRSSQNVDSNDRISIQSTAGPQRACGCQFWSFQIGMVENQRSCGWETPFVAPTGSPFHR